MKFICNEKSFDWKAQAAIYEIKIQHEFYIQESEISKLDLNCKNSFETLMRDRFNKALMEIKEYLNSLDYNLQPIKKLKDPSIIEGEFQETKCTSES